MHLNDAGSMIEKWWQELAHKFPLAELDEHITMPNHFHGIIVIVDRRKREKDFFYAGKTKEQIKEAMAALPEKSAPLPAIVQWFKAMTTNEYIRGVKQFNWPRFERKLWQRNYYEDTIFSLRELQNIRQYIRANPAMWPYDRDNPAATTPKREQLGPLLARQFGITEEGLDTFSVTMTSTANKNFPKRRGRPMCLPR
jgi:putative transposase